MYLEERSHRFAAAGWSIETDLPISAGAESKCCPSEFWGWYSYFGKCSAHGFGSPMLMYPAGTSCTMI